MATREDYIQSILTNVGRLQNLPTDQEEIIEESIVATLKHVDDELDTLVTAIDEGVV
jgi:hypothetical protein